MWYFHYKMNCAQGLLTALLVKLYHIVFSKMGDPKSLLILGVEGLVQASP